RLSAFPVWLPVLLAAWGGRDPVAGSRSRRLGAAALAGLTAYALLSPYTFLAPKETLALAVLESRKTFGGAGRSLTLGALIPIGLGWPVAALALLGLATLDRRHFGA